jgi:hypothetical protein
VSEYDGRQFVGIDLRRRRTVIVRQSETGEQVGSLRTVNDPLALAREISEAGPAPEVVLEAAYGWYWPRTRLPEAWLAPSAVRELVRHRAKLCRSGPGSWPGYTR